MAPKRRGGSGSSKPPGSTLGTLLRTAIQQAGGVRDALTRGAQQGRSKIDELRADRRRHEALAELGELVLDLIRRGEIDIAELPEARELVAHLDELDAADAQEDITSTQPFERRRFDDRGAPPASPRSAPRGPAGADDGTVGSGARWAPKTPSRPSAPESAASARVWRPTAEDVEAAPVVSRDMPRHPHKGGISFEDDDLADYMHPDDVPSKDPTGGDS